MISLLIDVMDLLFTIPESLSPRMKWMREHDVHTRICNDEEDPWTAWTGEEAEAIPAGRFSVGVDENQAIERLATFRGWNLW